MVLIDSLNNFVKVNQQLKFQTPPYFFLTNHPLAYYLPTAGLPTILSKSENLGIVLYERDCRKKWDKLYNAPSGVTCVIDLPIEYTSKNDAYFAGVMQNNFAPGTIPANYTEFELLNGSLSQTTTNNCTSVKVRYRIFQ